jgi:hypothetical protein
MVARLNKGVFIMSYPLNPFSAKTLRRIFNGDARLFRKIFSTAAWRQTLKNRGLEQRLIAD